MGSVVAATPPGLGWKTGKEILLLITDGDHYNETLLHAAGDVTSRFDQTVFLSANRPVSLLRPVLEDAKVPLDGIQFVDCISAMTGIMPPREDGVLFIESPTMLEKTALRAQQFLKRAKGTCCLVVDSLSTLAVYNGEGAVGELVHNLVTALRMQGTPAVLIVVETQAEEGLIETAASHCDRVVRL